MQPQIANHDQSPSQMYFRTVVYLQAWLASKFAIEFARSAIADRASRLLFGQMTCVRARLVATF